nr:polyprenyl synthetase family protein [uncultured Pseudomonas sp.]
MTVVNHFLEQSDYQTAEAQWREAFEYQDQMGGKKVRTAIAWALGDLYKLPAEKIRVLCTAIELINTSSLIHDDILDGDLVRRGLPTVWARDGVEIALNTGMYGYIAGLQRLTELSNIDILQSALAALECLHVGQHLDFIFSTGDKLPTLVEYHFIAQANTSCLFVFLLDACQCLAPLEDSSYLELKSLFVELGFYYRGVNDYCDLNHIPHFEKKGFAPDLEGGPKSLLMVLAGQPLVKGKKTAAQKNQILNAYGRAGVFEAALALMEEAYATIEQHLETVRRNHPEYDVHLLVELLNEIRFQPAPEDNYYLQCLA